MQTFAKESTDASIISAGIESPGSEVSYKMPFSEIVPPAEPVSSPVTISEWIEKVLAGEKSIGLPADLISAENQKRTYVIGGNLKMKLTPSGTVTLIRAMAERIKKVVEEHTATWEALENIDIVIAPSYTSLSKARETIDDS